MKIRYIFAIFSCFFGLLSGSEGPFEEGVEEKKAFEELESHFSKRLSDDEKFKFAFDFKSALQHNCQGDFSCVRATILNEYCPSKSYPQENCETIQLAQKYLKPNDNSLGRRMSRIIKLTNSILGETFGIRNEDEDESDTSLIDPDMSPSKIESFIEKEVKKLPFATRIGLNAQLERGRALCFGSDSCLRKKISKACKMLTSEKNPHANLVCRVSEYVGNRFEYGKYGNLLPANPHESERLNKFFNKLSVLSRFYQGLW